MIIGISGAAGAGKDTAAQVLVDKYKFEKISVAKPIKDLVSNMFNIDRFLLEGSDCKMRTLRENPKFGIYNMSGRQLLQEIGTGLRHIVHQDIWIDMLMKDCKPSRNYVVSDVRFPNEISAIQNKGGIVIRVFRNGCEGDGHESERALDNVKFDITLGNNETISDLHHKVETILKYKLKG